MSPVRSRSPAPIFAGISWHSTAENLSDLATRGNDRVGLLASHRRVLAKPSKTWTQYRLWNQWNFGFVTQQWIDKTRKLPVTVQREQQHGQKNGNESNRQLYRFL